MYFIIPTTPIPKPRMTRSDKYKKRPCVLKYREWADEARLAVTGNRSKKLSQHFYVGVHASFYLPVPKSTPKNVASQLAGSPHYTKPDLDNLIKALLDALFDNDSEIPFICARKFYTSETPKSDPCTRLFLLTKEDIRKEALSYNASESSLSIRDGQTR